MQKSYEFFKGLFTDDWKLYVQMGSFRWSKKQDEAPLLCIQNVRIILSFYKEWFFLHVCIFFHVTEMNRLENSGDPTVHNIAKRLREFRETMRLREDEMAKLLSVPTEELLQVESSHQPPSPEWIAEYARFAGVEIGELLTGEFVSSPPVLLFRLLPNRELSVTEMVNTGMHRVLGEFIRCVRRIKSLQIILGETKDLAWLTEFHLLPSPRMQPSEIYKLAEVRAYQFREYLGLDTQQPIISMKQLLEKLGVSLFFVSPQELDPNIDGASTVVPAPAILVNLIEGSQTWWRTRMTLAHELCHLLFDLSQNDPTSGESTPMMWSPQLQQDHKLPERWRMLPDHENLEKHANAFAAYFLAPSEAVRSVVGTCDPTSEVCIRRVAGHFGLGRITAVNVLTNVYKLRRSTRYRMLDRPEAISWDSSIRFDEEPTVGLHAGLLQELTLHALSVKKIDKVEARRYLNLPLTEALPGTSSMTEEDLAPLVSHEEVIRRSVERQVQSKFGPDYYGGHVEPCRDGWLVEILHFAQQESQSVGTALFTFDHNVDKIDLAVG